MKHTTTKVVQTQKSWVSVDVQAALVPFFALLIQAGYAAAREGRIYLVSLLFHPSTLPIMILTVMMASLTSYCLLRPFRYDHSARSFVFFLAVAAFAGVACFYTWHPIVK